MGRAGWNLRPRPSRACPAAGGGRAAGEFGFRFDRSGYRVPAVIVSPWVEPGSVYNEEYRHTSLIATLRERWELGDPFTARDAAARSFSHVFSRDAPRDPRTWPVASPRSVPQYIQDALALGQTLSTLGKAAFEGIRGFAEENNIEIEGLPKDPKAEIPPEQALNIVHNFLALSFPLLAQTGPSVIAPKPPPGSRRLATEAFGRSGSGGTAAEPAKSKASTASGHHRRPDVVPATSGLPVDKIVGGLTATAAPVPLHTLPIWVDIFAMSINAAFGAAVARNRRLTLLAVLIAGVIVGLGGGMVRDVLLGLEAAAIEYWYYLPAVLGAALVGGFLAHRLIQGRTSYLVVRPSDVNPHEQQGHLSQVGKSDFLIV